jgi:hypothetical protein
MGGGQGASHLLVAVDAKVASELLDVKFLEMGRYRPAGDFLRKLEKNGTTRET